jgi:hypothetical protein
LILQEIVQYTTYYQIESSTPTHNKTEPSGGDKAKFQVEILPVPPKDTKLNKFFSESDILKPNITINNFDSTRSNLALLILK